MGDKESASGVIELHSAEKREADVSRGDDGEHGCRLMVHSQLLTTSDLHQCGEGGRASERAMRNRIDRESQSSGRSDRTGLSICFPQMHPKVHVDPEVIRAAAGRVGERIQPAY